MSMKQEYKDLLMKDLSARLPYGVVVKDRNGVHTLTPGNTEFIDLFNGKCNIAPYLFPLSSMTEEQKSFLHYNTKFSIDVYRWGELVTKFDEEDNYLYTDLYDYLSIIDWLNKNHFDYRGLIEKGLAIDATGLNIY